MDVGHFVTSTTTALATLCTTTLLPASGVISLYNGDVITLDQAAIYAAPCPTLTPRDDPNIALASGDTSLSLPDEEQMLSDYHDPFYTSTFPICYALAATTVTAYMLVIMLFITPRSFLDGGVVRLSRRSFTNSSSNGVTIGGRPWLQKVAALTVAISLTIATADTIRIARQQYLWGAQNGKVLQIEVMGSTELKVSRLISDTFLWLAQAQTLIRLFPRQREKIIIKWAAFALISLDVVFSAINSFKYSENGINVSRQANFGHPIPTLSYLFQLTLGVLYAAWVIYYALMKKRYAFYHPLMKNIFLVAVISIISIIVPIVFFTVDISNPKLTGWGDYVRWVGAAAASVVVWEWVERIEALEREEKKDGILGREVFDGDDTLEVNAAEFPWFRQRKHRKDDPDNRGSRGSGGRPQGSHGWGGVSAIAGQARARATNVESSRRTQREQRPSRLSTQQPPVRPRTDALPPLWPTRPAATATPISRTDTASAASTVYAVRYQETMSRASDLPTHPASESAHHSSGSPGHVAGEEATSAGPSLASTPAGQNGRVVLPPIQRPAAAETTEAMTQDGRAHDQYTRTPTIADTADRTDDISTRVTHQGRDEMGRWDLKARLEEFAANQADKIRERLRPTLNTQNLPVMVIPAPARRGAALQQVLEEEETRAAGSSETTATTAPVSTTTSPPNSTPSSRPANGNSSRDAADEMTQLDRSRSVLSGQDPPLPPSNPPLWPGVQHRHMYDDDDDEYLYDDSSMISDSVSGERERRDSEDGSRPSANR